MNPSQQDSLIGKFCFLEPTQRKLVVGEMVRQMRMGDWNGLQAAELAANPKKGIKGWIERRMVGPGTNIQEGVGVAAFSVGGVLVGAMRALERVGVHKQDAQDFWQWEGSDVAAGAFSALGTLRAGLRTGDIINERRREKDALLRTIGWKELALHFGIGEVGGVPVMAPTSGPRPGADLGQFDRRALLMRVREQLQDPRARSAPEAGKLIEVIQKAEEKLAREELAARLAAGAAGGNEDLALRQQERLQKAVQELRGKKHHFAQESYGIKWGTGVAMAAVGFFLPRAARYGVEHAIEHFRGTGGAPAVATDHTSRVEEHAGYIARPAAPQSEVFDFEHLKAKGALVEKSEGVSHAIRRQVEEMHKGENWTKQQVDAEMMKILKNNGYVGEKETWVRPTGWFDETGPGGKKLSNIAYVVESDGRVTEIELDPKTGAALHTGGSGTRNIYEMDPVRKHIPVSTPEPAPPVDSSPSGSGTAAGDQWLQNRYVTGSAPWSSLPNEIYPHDASFPIYMGMGEGPSPLPGWSVAERGYTYIGNTLAQELSVPGVKHLSNVRWDHLLPENMVGKDIGTVQGRLEDIARGIAESRKHISQTLGSHDLAGETGTQLEQYQRGLGVMDQRVQQAQQNLRQFEGALKAAKSAGVEFITKKSDGLRHVTDIKWKHDGLSSYEKIQALHTLQNKFPQGTAERAQIGLELAELGDKQAAVPAADAGNAQQVVAPIGGTMADERIRDMAPAEAPAASETPLAEMPQSGQRAGSAPATTEPQVPIARVDAGLKNTVIYDGKEFVIPKGSMVHDMHIPTGDVTVIIAPGGEVTIVGVATNTPAEQALALHQAYEALSPEDKIGAVGRAVRNQLKRVNIARVTPGSVPRMQSGIDQPRIPGGALSPESMPSAEPSINAETPPPLIVPADAELTAASGTASFDLRDQFAWSPEATTVLKANIADYLKSPSTDFAEVARQLQMSAGDLRQGLELINNAIEPTATLPTLGQGELLKIDGALDLLITGSRGGTKQGLERIQRLVEQILAQRVKA